MTKQKIKNELVKAQETKSICNIFFKYDKSYYNVIPLMCGEKLLLYANEDDFILDGYSIRRNKDILKVKIKDDKCNEILRKEGVEAIVPAVNIENWTAAFDSLKRINKNIIVEKEDLNPKNTEFVIGRIFKVHKKHAYVYHFDADGIWDEEPYKIPFNEITSVTFDSRYVTIFSKYVNEPTLK